MVEKEDMKKEFERHKNGDFEIMRADVATAKNSIAQLHEDIVAVNEGNSGQLTRFEARFTPKIEVIEEGLALLESNSKVMHDDEVTMLILNLRGCVVCVWGG